MKSVNLSILRIIEISTAIDIIGSTDALDGTTGYKLGRLKKTCEAIVKIFQSIRETEQKKYAKELDSKSTSKERKKQIVDLMNEKMREIEVLEEEIKVPEIKLSEFIAKSDRTVKFPLGEGKSETREVKEGQMLVSQVFFNLMGEIIVDDKNTGTYEEPKATALQAFLERTKAEQPVTETQEVEVSA